MSFRAFLLLLTFAFPTTAFCQASLSAGVGVPIAPSTLTDQYNPGFGFSGSFPLPIRALIMQPRFTAGFDVLQVDSEFLESRGGELGVEIEGGDLSAVHVGFDVQFIRPHAAIKPYVSPFLGFALISIEDFSIGGITFSGGEAKTAVAIGGAVGVAVQLPIGPYLFVEGRVVHAFTEGDGITWAPVRAGVAFDLD